MKNKTIVFLLLFLVFVPIVSADYQDTYLEISKGNVPGHIGEVVRGLDESVGTTEYILWQENTGYTWRVTSTLMNLSSTSANDDNGNTGAWTVTVYGLDGTYGRVNETVTMDGQTPVSTVNQYLRINHLVVEHVGTAGANVGVIYIGTGATVAGKPTVIHNEINVGFGRSYISIYTIPDGYTGYIVFFQLGTDTTKIIEASLQTRCVDCVGNSWRTDYHTHYSDATINPHITLPYGIQSHTDIKITARNSVGQAFASTEIFLVLVKDGYELINQTISIDSSIPVEITGEITGEVDIMSTAFMVFCGIAFITLGAAWLTPDNKKAAFIYAFSTVFWLTTMYQWAVDYADTSSWALMFVFLIPLTFCIIMFIEKNWYTVDEAMQNNMNRRRPY